MIMHIDDNRKISEIQEEFNQKFPFLKIEFLTGSKLRAGLCYKKILHDSALTIGECRIVHTKGQISIDPTMSVTELEKNFKDIYGLHVRLFRKSSKVWLDTSVTDSWTLHEQN